MKYMNIYMPIEDSSINFQRYSSKVKLTIDTNVLFAEPFSSHIHTACYFLPDRHGMEWTYTGVPSYVPSAADLWPRIHQTYLKINYLNVLNQCSALVQFGAVVLEVGREVMKRWHLKKSFSNQMCPTQYKTDCDIRLQYYFNVQQFTLDSS